MTRAEMIGPVTITLVGAGAGLCLAMLHQPQTLDRARVHLDESVPLASASAGCVAGLGLGAICARYLQAKTYATVAALALLGAAASAPLGWIAGDMGWVVGEAGDGRHPREGMAGGAAAGFVGGVVAGAFELRADKRGRSAEPVAAPDRRQVA